VCVFCVCVFLFGELRDRERDRDRESSCCSFPSFLSFYFFHFSHACMHMHICTHTHISSPLLCLFLLTPHLSRASKDTHFFRPHPLNNFCRKKTCTTTKNLLFFLFFVSFFFLQHFHPPPHRFRFPFCAFVYFFCLSCGERKFCVRCCMLSFVCLFV